MKNKLDAVTQQLDMVQARALDVLESARQDAQTSYDRQNLGDMIKILKLDIENRETLASIQGWDARREVDEASYGTFLRLSGMIVSLLSECEVPFELLSAFKTITKAITGGERLSVTDVYTVVSVIITTVSLCLHQLQVGAQRDLILKLDSLLALKTKVIADILQ